MNAACHALRQPNEPQKSNAQHMEKKNSLIWIKMNTKMIETKNCGYCMFFLEYYRLLLFINRMIIAWSGAIFYNGIDNGEKIMWKKWLTEQRIPKIQINSIETRKWSHWPNTKCKLFGINKNRYLQNCFIESAHFGNARGFCIDSMNNICGIFSIQNA